MIQLAGTTPEFIFETSWEVCNKIGGIYTVLSTRASTMTQKHGAEKVVFVGPLLQGIEQTDFVEDGALDSCWARIQQQSELPIKVGHWNVPGRPRCVLVDYKPLYSQKDQLYYLMWEKYGIKGEIGYGDYDESCLFAIAAAQTIRLMAQQLVPEALSLAIFNEWTTGMGLLYLQLKAPNIATFFITHATTVGRSIAGNGKPLYSCMPGYNGDQMAQELHVECKHQVEKAAAHAADTFGVVSEVTQVECWQLLEKGADVIVCNGFEPNFVPNSAEREKIRQHNRNQIAKLVQTLYGTELPQEALIIATSGRNEYRNKGLDVYLDMLQQLALTANNSTPIVPLILVPGWVQRLRPELLYGMQHPEKWSLPMCTPYVTHELHDAAYSPIMQQLKHIANLVRNKPIYPVYIPAYISASDKLLNTSYYELLPAIDLTLFPSYYEPWGYTPLESIAMGVPTITTDKSGFGRWAQQYAPELTLDKGVCIVPRTDDNHKEVVTHLTQQVLDYASKTTAERQQIQVCAEQLSYQAYWSQFYGEYEKGFANAVKRMQMRVQNFHP